MRNHNVPPYDCGNAAVIIGAGPAGLTAASELQERTSLRPIVIEMSEHVGGLARTIDYKGNRLDIGSHRFFSKSDRVIQWWLNVLPLERNDESSLELTYQNQRHVVRPPEAGGSVNGNNAMLVRNRVSRIYFDGKFYDYPLNLNQSTLRNLGPGRIARIAMSYLAARCRPIRPERNLEDFFINRFGRELYLTFFKSYTEKVWGTECSNIDASWGAQRVRGLSVGKALIHLLRTRLRLNRTDVLRQRTETSLVERFLYPKFGAGQMWQEVARRVQGKGGMLLHGWRVTEIAHSGGRVTVTKAMNVHTGEEKSFAGKVFLSSMPVRDLVAGFRPFAPSDVREVTDGLVYRDFIVVGLLCDRLTFAGTKRIDDNWIYIHDPRVKAGRVQIFNNWSPHMVADPGKLWIGVEYFCDEGDAFWRLPDEEIARCAVSEMDRIHLVRADSVRESTVVRAPKAYPAYVNTYKNFDKVVRHLNGFENLFPIGRNGMHRYNNQDHSMLAAMAAIDAIACGSDSREKLWSVNSEPEYHESA